MIYICLTNPEHCTFKGKSLASLKHAHLIIKTLVFNYNWTFVSPALLCIYMDILIYFIQINKSWKGQKMKSSELDWRPMASLLQRIEDQKTHRSIRFNKFLYVQVDIYSTKILGFQVCVQASPASTMFH